jgi:hypothetical protein
MGCSPISKAARHGAGELYLRQVKRRLSGGCVAGLILGVALRQIGVKRG